MTKKLSLGWKVIRPGRTSLLAWSTAKVTYHKGRKAVPCYGMGTLAVFQSVESARCFKKEISKDNLYDLRIVKCKYRPSERTTLAMFVNDLSQKRHITRLPVGTVLAESVTCLQ